jgi:hypothetical protein
VSTYRDINLAGSKVEFAAILCHKQACDPDFQREISFGRICRLEVLITKGLYFHLRIQNYVWKRNSFPQRDV